MKRSAVDNTDVITIQNPGRRKFLSQTSSAMFTAPFLGSFLSGQAAAQAAGNVSLAAYGGTFNEALVSSYMDAFQAKTGIAVNVGSGASLALAKLQIASGTAQWDIVELTGNEYMLAVEQDLLLPLDYDVIDTSNTPDEFKERHGIVYFLSMGLMVYDKRKITDADAPKDWVEFWDTERFPGRRSLYSNLADGIVLECALLADGVPADELYPLDVERALASLDRLGKENIIWHSSNTEPIQQLIDGQVSLAMAHFGVTNRAINSGAELGFNAQYGGLKGDYLAIMKTTQNAKEAMELVNFMVSDVEANVRFVESTYNGVPNTAVVPLLSSDLVNRITTSPTYADTAWLKNSEWWAENLESTLVRFKEWQFS